MITLYSTLPRAYHPADVHACGLKPTDHFRMQVIQDGAEFTVEQLDIVDGKVWNCTAWNTQPTLDAAIEKAHS